MSDILERLRDELAFTEAANKVNVQEQIKLKAACESLRAEVEALRAAAGAVIRVWESPSWNWSHTGSAADAMNALSAAIDAARKEPT